MNVILWLKETPIHLEALNFALKTIESYNPFIKQRKCGGKKSLIPQETWSSPLLGLFTGPQIYSYLSNTLNWRDASALSLLLALVTPSVTVTHHCLTVPNSLIHTRVQAYPSFGVKPRKLQRSHWTLGHLEPENHLLVAATHPLLGLSVLKYPPPA